ncbi:MAG: hypothetical protein A2V99_19170 [Spirochaetes bacterium RBG_16_67_19]|nr:MAG: hypothetical protein A2V99_19170 [Spirochaetes bacterium RBG_16_67_19]
MKKLWILFTALALLAVAMPAIADVTTGAVFYWYGITDFDDATADVAKVHKARIKVAGDVDEYNKIATELRYGQAGGSWNGTDVEVQIFTLTTDITGALGLDLPVTIKSTVGVWESDFTSWWYVANGWGFVGGANDDNQINGAAQLDLGFGPATLHYYQNMGAGAESTMMVGVDGAFGPVAAWLAYKAEAAALGDGALFVEAKYAGSFGDLALSIYPALKYDLAASALGWNVGVKAGFKMLTVGAVVGGTDPDYFDKVAAELGAAFGNAGLRAAAYMDLSNTDVLAGVDLMASYKFGAATFYLGYAIDGDNGVLTIPIDDEWTASEGLYLGVKASL